MAERPSTPPRTTHSGSLPRNPITPEQVRRNEEARLKAKALRAQHDAAAAVASAKASSSTSIAGQKRPHSQISSCQNVPDNVRNAGISPANLSTPASDAAIRPAKKFERNAYIEYDFAKMTDTKGGFLSSLDDPDNKTLNARPENDPLAGKPAHMTLAEWERAQLLKKLRASKAGPFEPGLSILDSKDKKTNVCRECGRMEIDFQWIELFQCSVCHTCKEKYPEKYSLLTKTEAREDYLLTNPELEDTDLFPRWEKPNPHKSTWNNMLLFLRYQVEEYAFSDRKWGSQEALDAEFERREGTKKSRKEKGYKKKLDELKKRTRVEAWKRQKGSGLGGGMDVKFGDRVGVERHEHEWGELTEDPKTGVTESRCVGCGVVCEEIVF
ncbi:DNA repair protein [Tothia fuscella]|uniref:DNA repair protein RAD14 n=1 Tax=Tothia fuscella TaxID=1048955 RepID=A0A9P4NL21_9PEZI|nr:DNA repair protein [Tothia fuscella]